MGFLREFNWVIVTKKEEQVSFEVNDTINTPLEKRGFQLTITKNGYREYPMDTPIRWIHMGEEKGMYKIYKLIWEEGTTKIYIKEVA